MELLDVVKKIKEKKELKSLDDTYVLQHLESLLDAKTRTKIKDAKAEQFFRSKEFDALRSAIRKRLRETYGVFASEPQAKGVRANKETLLKKMSDEKTTLEEKNIALREILTIHQSTNERLPYYSLFYEQLFAQVGKQKTLFDIGCGLNPVSYPLMSQAFNNTYTPTYVCCDISSEDMNFLKRYFAIMNIDGEAHTIDALNTKAIEHIILTKKPDVALLLKLADTLETLERHSSKKLVSKLLETCAFVVVSFPTISLGGGKVIPEKRRSWFEKFIEKNEYSQESFELPNEKVYVLSKRKN